MSTRNFVTVMNSTGRLDAGTYKCDLDYTNPVNQTPLTEELVQRIMQFANSANGKLESRVVEFPTPAIRKYVDVYAFLNRESMLFFAQEVGYIRSTRSIEFNVDYASLQALL